MKFDLNQYYPDEINSNELSSKKFFDDYLSENKPVVVREYAKDWPATKKWDDKEYLGTGAGNAVVGM